MRLNIRFQLFQSPFLSPSYIIAKKLLKVKKKFIWWLFFRKIISKMNNSPPGKSAFGSSRRSRSSCSQICQGSVLYCWLPRPWGRGLGGGGRQPPTQRRKGAPDRGAARARAEARRAAEPKGGQAAAPRRPGPRPNPTKWEFCSRPRRPRFLRARLGAVLGGGLSRPTEQN